MRRPRSPSPNTPNKKPRLESVAPTSHAAPSIITLIPFTSPETKYLSTITATIANIRKQEMARKTDILKVLSTLQSAIVASARQTATTHGELLRLTRLQATFQRQIDELTDAFRYFENALAEPSTTSTTAASVATNDETDFTRENAEHIADMLDGDDAFHARLARSIASEQPDLELHEIYLHIGRLMKDFLNKLDHVKRTEADYLTCYQNYFTDQPDPRSESGTKPAVGAQRFLTMQRETQKAINAIYEIQNALGIPHNSFELKRAFEAVKADFFAQSDVFFQIQNRFETLTQKIIDMGLIPLPAQLNNPEQAASEPGSPLSSHSSFFGSSEEGSDIETDSSVYSEEEEEEETASASPVLR